MKWIRASERLPEVMGDYHLKTEFGNFTALYSSTPFPHFMANGTMYKRMDYFEKIQWLDESAVPLHQSNDVQKWERGDMKDCLELVRSALSAKITYSKDADLKKELQKTVNSINICLIAHQSNDEDEWNKAIDEANKNYKPTVVHPHVQMLEYLKKHFHITPKPDTTIHQTGNQKPDE